MSNNTQAAADTDVSAPTDILIPTTTDKVPIKCENNRAAIAGALHEVSNYLTRKRLFLTLIKHRAVVLHTGKTVFDSVQSLQFYSGIVDDRRDFDKPAPPTPARINAFEAATGGKFTRIASVPDTFRDNIIISEALVEAEDARFLTLLEHVFGQCDFAEPLIEQSNGSGTTFLANIRLEELKAKPEDRVLIQTKFDNIRRTGVSGELDLPKLTAFLKAYKARKRCLPGGQRPSDESEVEMINMLAFKADKDLRRDYKAACHRAPPTTLEMAVELLKDALRDEQRCEEIDEELHGGARAKAGTITALLAKQDALEKQLAALQAAPADPNKNQRGDGRDGGRRRGGKAKGAAGDAAAGDNKDAQGRFKEWREGMRICRCKNEADGGKHPFHLCPHGGKTPEQRAAEAAAAAPAAATPTPAKLVLDEADSAAAAELAAQVEAFFASAEPAVESSSAFVIESAANTATVSSSNGPAVATVSSRASRRASNLLGAMADK